MKSSRRPFLIAIAASIAIALVGISGCSAWRVKKAADLARQSEPFETSPPNATATLLIVGDSTAVGTGASSPDKSIAGLIASAHPSLKIINRAVDGAKLQDIVMQLERTDEQRFDAVLILGGGNDVIRFTSEEAIAFNVNKALQLARAQSDAVYFMPSGNVGNAPFFFPPLSWLMSSRSRALHEYASAAASQQGVRYINLYKPERDDPFAQRPAALHAEDGLHPSDEGYLLWYKELNARSDFAAKMRARAQ